MPWFPESALKVIDTMPKFLFFLLCLFIPACVSNCTQSVANEYEQGQMVDSGSWYSRVRWPHDGNPYESLNFKVFSDAASKEARRAAAEVGEEILEELTDSFGVVAKDVFRYPTAQNKIHIYVYKNRFPQAWGARAYYAGFVIWSLDHEHRSTDLDFYKRTAKHEMVHVVEALLKGRDVRNMTVESMVHVWFSEGFGEAITGGTTGRAVRDLGYMNYLTDKYGMICPVSIVHDGMAGDWSTEETAAASGAAGSEFYYPMYHLAVKYLIDPEGHGRSIQDAVRMYTDIGAGIDFKTAFKNRMGISVKEYEAQFFILMNDYLDEGESVVVKRVAIVWLVLIAVSLIAGLWVIFRDTRLRWGMKLMWLMSTVLFGPLGFLFYCLSVSQGTRPNTYWRKAIKSSVVTVTWNVVAYVLISAAVTPFLEHTATVGPENFVVLFILVWLAGYAVFAAARSRGWYRAGQQTRFLNESISMVLAITGIFIVFIPLSQYWWAQFDPQTAFFWGLIPIAAIIGVLFAYPYRARLTNRNAAIN